MKTLIKTYKNGTKEYAEECKCWKCYGTGTYSWGSVINGVPQFAGVCYACGGTGVTIEKTREYTHEHEPELAKARAKKEAARQAEREVKEAEREMERQMAKEAEERRQAKIQAEREARIANSQHIGTVGERLEVVLTLRREVSYDTQFGTTYIYLFDDDHGNTVAWKTSTIIKIEGLNENGASTYIRKGDVIKVKATVKAHEEYKGEKQTAVTRLKVLELVSKHQELTDEQKKENQMATLEDGDRVVRMPYRQYKDHYADCETLAGTYKEIHGTGSIEVIIRDGRMKPSGVRGQHFSGYEFKNEDGLTVCYCAVSCENAQRRAEKEYPECKWELSQIYNYATHRIW